MIPAEYQALYVKYFTYGHEDMTLVHKYLHILPFGSAAIYLAMVFFLPSFLSKTLKFGGFGDKLKWFLFSWNIFLSLFSLAMLLGVGIPFFQLVSSSSLADVLCDVNKNNWAPSTMLFWAYMFVLSKFLELVDTFFLIIKNPSREIPFLHWFHHFTVLLFTWYAAYYRYGVGGTFATMNAFIHTFMYFYYALTDLGYKPSWALALTLGQITQMFGGIFFNGYWVYMLLVEKRDCLCDNPQVIIISCAIMYSVYLYLFVRFFYRRYITGEIAAKKSGKPATDANKSPKSKTKKDE